MLLRRGHVRSVSVNLGGHGEKGKKGTLNLMGWPWEGDDGLTASRVTEILHLGAPSQYFLL